jgi:soluble lytic murein transglycosylase-like protein
MTSGLRAAIAAHALLALSISLPSPSLAQSPSEDIAPKAAAVVVVPEGTVGIAPARVAPGARPYDSLIASHASSNGVPAEIVHRIIVRESRYRASAMGRGGASGLMQIKLATARSMGYAGSAAGLLDPDTNLTYGVRYLAGAYRAAGGHHGRAVGYYSSGYRGAARPAHAYAKMAPQPAVFATAASEEPVVIERKARRKKR